LDPAPARIPRDVYNWRQRLMRSARARFFGRHRIKRFDKVRIEGCGKANRLRKTGCANGGLAVQAFLMENYGNAQARVLDEKLLDCVGELGVFTRIFALSGIAGAAYLPDAMALFETGFRLLQVEIAITVQESFGLLLPDARHLRGFFVQRH